MHLNKLLFVSSREFREVIMQKDFHYKSRIYNTHIYHNTYSKKRTVILVAISLIKITIGKVLSILHTLRKKYSFSLLSLTRTIFFGIC